MSSEQLKQGQQTTATPYIVKHYSVYFIRLEIISLAVIKNHLFETDRKIGNTRNRLAIKQYIIFQITFNNKKN